MSELNRQMRALERLGEESRKALFFAASRRLMLDLMRGPDRHGRSARGTGPRDATDELPDGEMVVSALTALRRRAGRGPQRRRHRARREGARRSPSRRGSARSTPRSPGSTSGSVCPTTRVGSPRRSTGESCPACRATTTTCSILQLLLDVALATGLDELVETITPMLLPYAGRAVINAGAVMFHGVTDDTLARACERLGDAERAAALREKALATYRRIGATWWRERLEARCADDQQARAVDRDDLATRTGRRVAGRSGIGGVGDPGAPRSRAPARAARRNPGREVSALRLAGGAETVEQAGLGEVVDAQALSGVPPPARRDRHRARRGRCVGRCRRAARELTAERDALLAEVSPPPGSAAAAHVRQRRRAGAGHGPQGDRDRTRRDPRCDPVVARHLTTHVRTGLWCSYEPDPDVPVEWRL